MLDIESRVSLQSITPDTDGLSPCDHLGAQGVLQYHESDVDKHGQTCGVEGRESPTFLDISNSMKSSTFTEIKTETDTDALSWNQKHPEHWTQKEILDWIYLVANTLNLDLSTVRGESFQNISGPEFFHMTLEDFQSCDPINGQCFHDMFRSLHKDAFFTGPQSSDYLPECHDMAIKQESGSQSCQYTPTQNRMEDNDFMTTTMRGSDMGVLIGTAWYDIDPSVEIPNEMDKVANHVFLTQPDNGYSSSDSESHSDASDSINALNGMYRHDSTGSDVISDDDMSQHSTGSEDIEETIHTKKHNSKKKLSKPTTPKKTQNRGRKPGQMSKGNHLWEFVRDLLRDPQYNPECLKWEEKETGVFRFVKSERIAQLWGKKKNNREMTYEKLSRAMRFCRTAGYFAEVPKTGKFPKKLCFRFGARAFGWED